MKYPVCFILILISFYCSAQSICNTVGENGTLTLTAPAGNYFTTIEFASYGTPNGSCGSFTTSSCHAANSVSICSTAFVGKTSASIAASNGVFGDPCGGTVKRLYVQAAYASIVPLKLISFVARNESGKIILEWICEEEVNTSHFIIESSNNGQIFYENERVAARGGMHNVYRYELDDAALNKQFRLKMVDKDQKYTFSNIIRVTGMLPANNLLVYPNPVKDQLIINTKGEGYITNVQGQLIRKIFTTAELSRIPVGNLGHGVYFIHIGNRVQKFIKN